MSVVFSMSQALPPHQHRQQDILDFMLNVYGVDEREARKVGAIYRKSGIETRYSAIADYSQKPEEWTFFPQNKDLTPFPTVEQRMAYFQKAALPLALRAVQSLPQVQYLPQVSHLITVSCTGISAPGLDIALLKALQLPLHTARSAVNFMGCYAGFHALRQADAICRADPQALVLIVDVELCTLHFQKKYDTDNVMANALFADGAAAVLVASEAWTQAELLQGIKLERFYAEIAPEGEQDMAWEISATGFQMTLSSYIPQLIQKGIADLAARALQKSQKQKAQIQHWAIHPGGRKILEAFQQALHLPEGALQASFDVLRAFGNMSSVSIFFVLQELWQRHFHWQSHERIFAAGFGPGLTIETALLSTFLPD